MVFQTFALFPWLTVLQNVQAGLDAMGVAEDEARKRALAAIDLIGLDGFENAYPRELSGGMRQRVGFARAMVVDPTILLMDEPFSALDVLTGETLRSDFIDLWTAGHLPIKSVLLVTHNIEEAVFMCDRILILSSNPGRIATEITVEPSTSAEPPCCGVSRYRRRYLQPYDSWTGTGGRQRRPKRWRASAPGCRSCRRCGLPALQKYCPRHRSAAMRTCLCWRRICILG